MSTPPFDVLTATASELQNRLKAGTLTSVEIITTYLAQIEKHNHDGAKLNAMISVAPREFVLKVAENLDRERSAGKIRGPLHGLPIIVKVSCDGAQAVHRVSDWLTMRRTASNSRLSLA
jgi:amidase